jgi:hypothetical protein
MQVGSGEEVGCGRLPECSALEYVRRAPTEAGSHRRVCGFNPKENVHVGDQTTTPASYANHLNISLIKAKISTRGYVSWAASPTSLFKVSAKPRGMRARFDGS